MTPITVAIPVGPREVHRRWLPEMMESIALQTQRPDEVLLIDDMGGLGPAHFQTKSGTIPAVPELRIWRAPWLLGVAHAFNFGVALARNDLVFMAGADDVLEPRCLEACVAEYEAAPRDGYFYVGVRYMDTGEEQTLPCNYAMVTKDFWRQTGGFPVESAVGAPDAAFISCLLVHRPSALIMVADGVPLVNYRRHGETETLRKPASWQGPIIDVRNLLTIGWTPPEWSRDR